MSRGRPSKMTLVGWTLVAGIATSALIACALLALAGSIEHGAIRIDGEPVDLTALGAEHWMIATAAVVVTLFTLLLVVPVTVAVTFAVAGVALLVATVAVAGTIALVLSPLIVVALAVWLLVRLLRRKATPDATIPP